MQLSSSISTVVTQYNSAYLRTSFIFKRVKIDENTDKSSINGKNGGASLAALVCFTGIESANALDFNFSYDSNFGGAVAGTVEGTIQGLNDNSTGAASAVLITSFVKILNKYLL